MRENWKYQPLGEICDFISGFTPSKQELNEKAGIPYFKVSDMNRDTNSVYMIETELFVVHPRKTIPANSIIFPKNGGAIFTGKKRILKYDSIIDLNTEALNIKDKNVNLQFLYTFLLGVDFGQFDNGGGLPSINIKKMKDFIVPVPPLTEQERIVSFLDAEFAKIDALKANTEQQLQAAKDLFQSALKEMLTPKEGWEDLYLVKEFDLRSGEYLPNKDQIGGKFPVYGGNGITGYHNEFNAYGEQILIGRVGALCGNIHYTNEKIWVTDNAFVVKGINNKWHIRFLTYELQFMNLNKYATQTAQPVISNKSMREVLIYRPSLPEQERIAARLDTISEKVKALQDNYDQTITLCNDLKQSLLKSIFE